MDKIVQIDPEGESINKSQFEEICNFFKTEEIIFQYDKETHKIILMPTNEE